MSLVTPGPRCYRAAVLRFFLKTFLVLAIFCAREIQAACVWKVTSGDGKILYLGGSVHALRKSDYPLPAPYLQAFDASSRLALEVDKQSLLGLNKVLDSEGKYRRGDSLKKHVDPRTYAWLRRLFELMNIPEENFAKYKPWYIVEILQSGSTHRAMPDMGVDEFLMRRAERKSMPVVGLETMLEHARVFSGLSDRESEILLLSTFIPGASDPALRDKMISAWRRGEAENLQQMTKSGFNEFPAFRERLLDARNRAWVPKIESYLDSGKVYFVVVGSAHFGGGNGVLALLRAKGYQIEQM